MTQRSREGIGPQAVGAYGEKIAEAELLRSGWTPSNVNASLKNARDYDIIAQRDGRVVLLRIKTCGPSQRGFQFSIGRGERFSDVRVPPVDFTILIRMGETRDGDQFWIVPTGVVRRRLLAAQIDYLGHLKADGVTQRIDNGQWTLWLDPLKRGSDRERPDFDIANAWQEYRDAWQTMIDAIATQAIPSAGT